MFNRSGINPWSRHVIQPAYTKFIQSIKKQIVHSRYVAEKLANREQLMLIIEPAVKQTPIQLKTVLPDPNELGRLLE